MDLSYEHAYEAANQCMDAGASFEQWSDPLPDASQIKECKVLCFSDGGVRKETRKASAGWVIVAVYGGKCWLLGRGGVLIEAGDMGSFMAEALGLDILMKKVLILCKHRGVRDNSWCTKNINYSLEEFCPTKRI